MRIGWMLKTEEGHYLAGLARDGRFSVSEKQDNAVRWPSRSHARELGHLINMKVVGLRCRQKGVSLAGSAQTGSVTRE